MCRGNIYVRNVYITRKYAHIASKKRSKSHIKCLIASVIIRNATPLKIETSFEPGATTVGVNESMCLQKRSGFCQPADKIEEEISDRTEQTLSHIGGVALHMWKWDKGNDEIQLFLIYRALSADPAQTYIHTYTYTYT